VGNQAIISSSNTLSGAFAGLGNQTVSISPLDDGPTQQLIGTSFTNYNFVDFRNVPSFPELLANFIPFGTGIPSNCSTNVADALAGQTCTLTANTIPSAPGG
jgi:hypothetical protein